MRQFHIVKRGNWYHYVCRVPADLLSKVPKAVLWQSLKTADSKAARVLAAGIEQRTQQLFIQLRSGMLTAEMEKRIVNAYLCFGVDCIESNAANADYPYSDLSLSPVDDYLHSCMLMRNSLSKISDVFALEHGKTIEELRDFQAEQIQSEIVQIQSEIAHRQPPMNSIVDMGLLSKLLKKRTKQTLTADEQQRLALKIAARHLDILKAERDSLQGDWSTLETLKSFADRAPFYSFSEVIEKYKEYYTESNKGMVKPRALDDLQTYTGALLEILGNISIDDVNSMDSVTKLKRVLRQYPRNRTNTFKNKALSSIIKVGKYEKISLSTANRYIGRMVDIINFANKFKFLRSTNVYTDERFTLDKLPHEQRDAYDKTDVERLVESLCTKPLWGNGDAKPERFWVLLISLLQGVRLGNVVELTKSQITVDEFGHDCIDLLAYGSDGVKANDTAQKLPLHWALVDIGFLKWVALQKEGRLFADSSKQFSQWYNRKDGGFEGRFITTDAKKCLYSTRHTFGGSMRAGGSDMKVIGQAMGHAIESRRTTYRYVGREKAEAIRAGHDKMKMEGLDLDRLKHRAVELFSL